VSARSAALSAQEVVDRKAAQAVADFGNAATACKSANSALSTAVASAATTVTTGPSSLADPTLIDALKAASTMNSAAKACTAPAMAPHTDAIRAQATALKSATDEVSTAAVSLQNAVDAVTASVQAKKDAAAAAAAAAAARTWHEDGGNGFTSTGSR
jgi:hypothetical protein